MFEKALVRRGALPLPVLLALALVLGSLPSYGFCPSNGVRCVGGVSGKTHEDITRSAVEEVDKALFARSELTTAMEHALDEIVDANAAVDLIESQKPSANHFDGENFGQGKARIVGFTNQIVAKLHDDRIADARKLLGGLLHTLQDFFSHSNWIENGNRGSYPALWQPGTPLAVAAGDLTDTCQPCPFNVACGGNILTTLLTSGYYNGKTENEDRQPQTTKKCRHGGVRDYSPGPAGGINKDTNSFAFSPHDALHPDAASSATTATKAYLEYLETRVSAREMKLLLGAGPTLALAIDTTGSMGKEIAGVRDQALQIVDSRLGTDEEPGLYVLAPFNDPVIGPVTVTSDAETFKAAIRALSASDGGDCPELAFGGILSALNNSLQEGELFVFTDADAKDRTLFGSVLGLALEKNIHINPFLFGSCSAFKLRQETAKGGATDPIYSQLANETGGQLFVLSPDEAGQITRLADAVVRTNAVDLLAVTDTLKGAPVTYSVPVDSTMTRVTFVLSGSTGLSVRRPSGALVQATDPDVQLTTVTSGMAVTIAAPTAGLWQATATGPTGAGFALAAKGEGSLSFDRFQFVELKDGAHPGYAPIEGLPVTGDEITAAALLSGPSASVQFELRNRAGVLLQTLGLTPDTGSSVVDYFGPVALSSQPFVVYARGTDTSGKAFQRVIVESVTPQTLRVLAPSRQDLPAGTTTTYTFEVKNSGPAGTFRATASDDLGFVTSLTPVQFDLAKNRKVKVSVKLTPPAANAGASDTLTLSVESVTGSGVRNFAVVASQVVAPPVP